MLRLLLTLVLLPLLAPAQETWNGEPYRPDKDTLHLWHLDETSPPFLNSANADFPLLGPQETTHSHPSLPRFGNALSFSSPSSQRSPHPALTLDSARPGTPRFQFAGQNGAFTMEALLKFDTLPTQHPSTYSNILTMTGGLGERVFLFRIQNDGLLAFIPLLEQGSFGGGLASIPNSGPHAINTTDWFHVAVTYSGTESVRNNLKLYWTRISPETDSKVANLIGQGTLERDLPNLNAPFTIGSEPGKTGKETGNFPGLIDEVRISGTVREINSFCFTPPKLRPPHVISLSPTDHILQDNNIKLLSLKNRGRELPLPSGNRIVNLDRGLQDLDINFEVLPARSSASTIVRYQLKGFDDNWRSASAGMSLSIAFQDQDGKTLSKHDYDFSSISSGWRTDLRDFSLIPRREPIFIPAHSKTCSLTLTSGNPDTTGLLVVDNLILTTASSDKNLIPNGDFFHAISPGTLGGRPINWDRSGSDPSIARLTLSNTDPALVLSDGSQEANGIWQSTFDFTASFPHDTPALLQWQEAYNIIPGRFQTASYRNIPPGDYTFHALASSARSESLQALSFSLHIPQPFYERPWFWTLVIGLAILTLAALAILLIRRQAQNRLAILKIQNALADDRARIARDMHDDLGTRVTVLNLKAAAVERIIEDPSPKLVARLDQLKDSARKLVVAMDDLVWAVNPTNDTLEKLASQITRSAQEIFRNTNIDLHLNIPTDLPDIRLSPEVRHHLALVTKEACNNIARHGGDHCQVTLTLALQQDKLNISIADTGPGFDTSQTSDGNGLNNMRHRVEELGGTYQLTSILGKGTTIKLSCKI